MNYILEGITYGFLIPWFFFSLIMFYYIYKKLKSFKEEMEQYINQLNSEPNHSPRHKRVGSKSHADGEVHKSSRAIDLYKTEDTHSTKEKVKQEMDKDYEGSSSV